MKLGWDDQLAVVDQEVFQVGSGSVEPSVGGVKHLYEYEESGGCPSKRFGCDSALMLALLPSEMNAVDDTVNRHNHPQELWMSESILTGLSGHNSVHLVS